MSSDRNFPYVTERAIPPSRPPASAGGAIHWLRNNLFNGVVDSALTVISITLVLWLVPPLVDWAILKGVWNANSLDECREIVVATHGEGARGACWAVFNGRVGLLLFGFYPPELRWRPALAFVLLFVALAPVLFRSLPGKLLWLSAAYPIIAFILIWGGFGLEVVKSREIGGLLLAITIAVTGIAIAITVAFVLAIGRQSSVLVVKAVCAAFIEFIRGVPLVVLLFAVMILLIYALPPGTWFDLILRAAIVVALASGACMADAIRGSIAPLPLGQWEAAAALGLSYRKATWLIILPQALKIASPQIVSASAGLFRDVSIVSMVGLVDPLGLVNRTRAVSDWNGVLWELYAVVILFYWVFSFSISRYSKYLERKLKADERRPINAG